MAGSERHLSELSPEVLAIKAKAQGDPQSSAPGHPSGSVGPLAPGAAVVQPIGGFIRPGSMDEPSPTNIDIPPRISTNIVDQTHTGSTLEGTMQEPGPTPQEGGPLRPGDEQQYGGVGVYNPASQQQIPSTGQDKPNPEKPLILHDRPEQKIDEGGIGLAPSEEMLKAWAAKKGGAK